MINRKTNLSYLTKNLFNQDYDQQTIFQSPLKSPDKSKQFLNQSPLKYDSIDNLIETQNIIKTQRPSEFNLKKILSKIDDFENVQDTQKPLKTIRFKRHDNFQSQPLLKIDVKNDLDDFFNNIDDQHIKKQQSKIKESKLYQLITFTDYVENLYGKDWFHNQIRRPRRQNTIQEFFDILE